MTLVNSLINSDALSARRFGCWHSQRCPRENSGFISSCACFSSCPRTLAGPRAGDDRPPPVAPTRHCGRWRDGARSFQSTGVPSSTSPAVSFPHQSLEGSSVSLFKELTSDFLAFMLLPLMYIFFFHSLHLPSVFWELIYLFSNFLGCMLEAQAT